METQTHGNATSNRRLFGFTQKSMTPRIKPLAVGSGLLALDLVTKESCLTLVARRAGGTCGNVLTILGYLGWQSYPVARLDASAASRMVQEDLKNWGVRLDFATMSPQVSPPILIHKIGVNSAGRAYHRFLLKCPTCLACFPTYKGVTVSMATMAAAAMPKPNVFFFDRVSRGNLLLAQMSAENGAAIVFEPSVIEDSPRFREALELAHILKYARGNRFRPRRVRLPSRRLLEIETLGSEGIRYRSRIPSCTTSGWRKLGAYRLDRIIDAGGAGDWFTAGLIHKLGAKGLSGFQRITEARLQESLRFGQALAAWNCKYSGARGGMYEVDKKTFQGDISTIMSYAKST